MNFLNKIFTKTTTNTFLKSLAINALSVVSSFAIASTELNKTAPEGLIAKDLMTQKSVDILDKHQGKIIYLDLWAHWCVSCSKTFPVMQNLQNKYPDQLAVVAVAIGSEDEVVNNVNFVNRVMKGEKPVFEILWDEENIPTALSEIHEIQGMPSTFIIAPDGKIRYFHSSVSDELEAEMDVLIQSLLSK
jgi:thiol-disulfide isomerase/thioredoxin